MKKITSKILLLFLISNSCIGISQVGFEISDYSYLKCNCQTVLPFDTVSCNFKSMNSNLYGIKKVFKNETKNKFESDIYMFGPDRIIYSDCEIKSTIIQLNGKGEILKEILMGDYFDDLLISKDKKKLLFKSYIRDSFARDGYDLLKERINLYNLEESSLIEFKEIFENSSIKYSRNPWSKNNNQIVFEIINQERRILNQGKGLFIFDLENLKMEEICNYGFNAVWSNDGKKILFQKKSNDLWIYDTFTEEIYEYYNFNDNETIKEIEWFDDDNLSIRIWRFLPENNRSGINENSYNDPFERLNFTKEVNVLIEYKTKEITTKK